MNKYFTYLSLLMVLTDVSLSDNRSSPGIKLDTPLAIQKASFRILDCLNTNTQLGETQILDNGEIVEQVEADTKPVIPNQVVISNENQIIRPQNYVITNFVGLSEDVWTIKYVMVSTIENPEIEKKYIVLYKTCNGWRIVGVGVPEWELVRFKTDYHPNPESGTGVSPK